jgi:hypothetical protein
MAFTGKKEEEIKKLSKEELEKLKKSEQTTVIKK